MTFFHSFLTSKSPLYDRWHKHPRHTFHHFIVFIAVSVAVGAVLLASIASTNFGEYTSFITPKIVYAEASMTTAEHTNQIVKDAAGLKSAKSSEKTKRATTLKKTAGFRRAALEAQIRTSPKDALRNVLSETALKSMPEAIKSDLERYETSEGVIRTRISENFETKTAQVQHIFRGDDKKEYDVFSLRANSNLYQ